MTQVDPARVTTCVLTGGFDLETGGGGQVLLPDEPAALRIGRDIVDDARVDRGC